MYAISLFFALPHFVLEWVLVFTSIGIFYITKHNYWMLMFQGFTPLDILITVFALQHQQESVPHHHREMRCISLFLRGSPSPLAYTAPETRSNMTHYWGCWRISEDVIPFFRLVYQCFYTDKAANDNNIQIWCRFNLSFFFFLSFLTSNIEQGKSTVDFICLNYSKKYV